MQSWDRPFSQGLSCKDWMTKSGVFETPAAAKAGRLMLRASTQPAIASLLTVAIGASIFSVNLES
jgi:hypothetical protein